MTDSTARAAARGSPANLNGGWVGGVRSGPAATSVVSIGSWPIETTLVVPVTNVVEIDGSTPAAKRFFGAFPVPAT